MKVTTIEDIFSVIILFISRLMVPWTSFLHVICRLSLVFYGGLFGQRKNDHIQTCFELGLKEEFAILLDTWCNWTMTSMMSCHAELLWTAKKIVSPNRGDVGHRRRDVCNFVVSCIFTSQTSIALLGTLNYLLLSIPTALDATRRILTNPPVEVGGSRPCFVGARRQQQTERSQRFNAGL